MNDRDMHRLIFLLDKAQEQTKDFDDRVRYGQAWESVWNTFQSGLRVGQEPNTLAEDGENTPDRGDLALLRLTCPECVTRKDGVWYAQRVCGGCGLTWGNEGPKDSPPPP